MRGRQVRWLSRAPHSPPYFRSAPWVVTAAPSPSPTEALQAPSGRPRPRAAGDVSAQPLKGVNWKGILMRVSKFWAFSSIVYISFFYDQS